MGKREISTILWFIAGWSGGGLVTGLMDVPAILAFVPGIMLAILVHWDPAHLFWSASKPRARTVRPINEVADELDRAGQGAQTEGDRARR